MTSLAASSHHTSVAMQAMQASISNTNANTLPSYSNSNLSSQTETANQNGGASGVAVNSSSSVMTQNGGGGGSSVAVDSPAESTPTKLQSSSLTSSTSSSIINGGGGNQAVNLAKHWSQKMHDSVVASINVDKNVFLSRIKGGSDSGLFVYFESLLSPNESHRAPPTSGAESAESVVSTISGKMYANEILLEIQGQKISGYTLHDVIGWLKQLAKTYQTINFRTVKSAEPGTVLNTANAPNSQPLALLPLELRTYLDERFQKGSIDYDLQQTIRENVYMRTVPCTTRQPRPGEINGQDYIFLSNEEFLQLEQNGDLLEYGVYNGHYYGTPKPPKEPKTPLQQSLQHQQAQLSEHHQRHQQLQDDSRPVKKGAAAFIPEESRKESIAEEKISKNDTTTAANSSSLIQPATQKTPTSSETHTVVNEQQPAAVTENSNINNDSSNGNGEILPYGWEKVEDPEYGTFYIDHINKQTTYENPLMQQNLSSSMKTFKPTSTSSLLPQNGGDSADENGGGHRSNGNGNGNGNGSLAANPRRNIYFTQNPNELKGEFLKTSLLKTSHGFGFTIIGANETCEDFLQIKFIVPDGAAYRDARLKQGDVLVYVNSECVLGYTHQDVVEIFQSIPVGNYVDLTVCRGYPLSIDPNDPNIEIMSLPAINNPNNLSSTPQQMTPQQQPHQQHQQAASSSMINPGAPLASVDDLTTSAIMNTSVTTAQQQQQQYAQMMSAGSTNGNGGLGNQSNEEYYCEEYEEMYVPIVKGPKGFGFTIADDSQMNHQKVKQILDRDRCCNLIENDILLEINGTDLRNLSHNQVVDVLKDCVKGQETIIKLKRRKYHIILPQPPSTSSLIGIGLSQQANTNDHQHPATPSPLHHQQQQQQLASVPGSSSSSSSSSATLLSAATSGKQQQQLKEAATANVNSGNSSTNGGALSNGGSSGSGGGEYKEFRPISALKQANMNFNSHQMPPKQQQQQHEFLNNNNGNFSSNQVAFNYERRSKTPNILQSSSSGNINGAIGGGYQTNGYSTLNGSVAGHGLVSTTAAAPSLTTTTGTTIITSREPQLRSKTPTTDRVLFQHSLSASSKLTNDAYGNGGGPDEYLFGPNVNNSHNKQHKSAYNPSELYSTVSKPSTKLTSTQQLVNQHLNNDHEDDDEVDSPLHTQQQQQQQQQQQHMPIYDSTTSIQHQRILQNLNKFNLNANTQVSITNTNRSKTPGPDMIYFRGANGGGSVDPYGTTNGHHSAKTSHMHQQQQKSSTISAAMLNGNGNGAYLSRSKTPTADIMYYPTPSSNGNSVYMNGTGTSKRGQSNQFENIYQPFAYNNNSVNQQQQQVVYDSADMMNGYGNANANGGGVVYGDDDMMLDSSNVNTFVDVDGVQYLEMTVELYRQDSGFGFRIIGGEEEGSQVAVGYIVQGGAAHVDGRLRPNDEIVMIDNECVLGATHRRVVQLMTIAGLNRRVKLMIRRRINGPAPLPPLAVNSSRQTVIQQPQQQRSRPSTAMNNGTPLIMNSNSNMTSYPYTITLFRNGNEGFGFVIISTLNKNGPSIGKIVENSPAERCKRLHVGDRILAVNSINITQMNHIEIVNLIKESGNSITLTIGPPLQSSNNNPSVGGDETVQYNPNKMNNMDYNMGGGGGGQQQQSANIMSSSKVQNGVLNNRSMMNQTPVPTKAIINQNEYHVIELRKNLSGGFGFSIRGGKEFNIPLFVLKLADQGPAALDGRLQVGDQILEINGCDAYQMTHSEAIERIKSGGNSVTLLVRRTGMPPPSITDIIAANATAAVASAQSQQSQGSPATVGINGAGLPSSISSHNIIQQQQQQHQHQHHMDATGLAYQAPPTSLRSKSPYLQQQYSFNHQSHQTLPPSQSQHNVKHFNSSGTLINRNF